MDNLPNNALVNPLVPSPHTARSNLIPVIVAVFFGILFVGALVGLYMEYQKNQALSTELGFTKQQLVTIQSQLKNAEAQLVELTSYKNRQEKTKQLYQAVRGNFSPQLSSANRIYLALLLDDMNVCSDIEVGSEQNLCRDIFNNSCSGYEYPNRELCGQLAILRNREISQPEIVAYCNNKEYITNDMSQAHCFQYFAKALQQPALCNEICKVPIGNTNCSAYCPINTGSGYIDPLQPRDPSIPPALGAAGPCVEQYKNDCRASLK